jgi:hypothetical protein
MRRGAVASICFVCAVTAVTAAGPADVRARIAAARAAGEPVVTHVIVALCDNRNQGIVPVPSSLGNGRSPSSNLYWGASFGMRTFFVREGYSLNQVSHSGRVLDRIVLSKVIPGSPPTELVIIAEAWDGAAISEATNRFLRLAAGHDPETVELTTGPVKRELQAGGDAAIIAFVGHDGLMDFAAPSRPKPNPRASPRASIVLACVSKPYFLELLTAGGSYPLLLTTGLMAPEAYTLEAALHAFAAGGTARDVHQAAAAAYRKYQKCGAAAAARLFWNLD